MKVGIITMVSDNYGNRLQNYALQQVLVGLGNRVETLNNPWEENYDYRKEWLKSNAKKIFYYITRKPVRYRRKLEFEKFNKRNIVFSNFWLNKSSDRLKAADFYDLFVCGSDQIWNSEAKEITGKYFADFAEMDKRASYAASFGIEEVVQSRKNEFSKYLTGLKYISVREQSGTKIVKNLTGRDAICHLDPTLLLQASEWDRVSSDTTRDKQRYVFCYFLGRPSEKMLRMLNSYQIKYNVKVYSIFSEGNSTHNNVGPSEFVSLIKNSEFVLTDSFHGTVFSIIYHKPFYTFSRCGVKESMDTRVTSLLEMLKLSERFEPQNPTIEDAPKIDYNKVDILLDQERKKAIDYLTAITTADK